MSLLSDSKNRLDELQKLSEQFPDFIIRVTNHYYQIKGMEILIYSSFKGYEFYDQPNNKFPDFGEILEIVPQNIRMHLIYNLDIFRS